LHFNPKEYNIAGFGGVVKINEKVVDFFIV
jgi:hypothetical protein